MVDVQVRDRISGFNGSEIIVRISADEFAGGRVDFSAAMQTAVEKLAVEYVEDNITKILENMSPIAITNLAIAASAKIVRTKFIDPAEEKK